MLLSVFVSFAVGNAPLVSRTWRDCRARESLERLGEAPSKVSSTEHEGRAIAKAMLTVSAINVCCDPGFSLGSVQFST